MNDKIEMKKLEHLKQWLNDNANYYDNYKNDKIFFNAVYASCRRRFK